MDMEDRRSIDLPESPLIPIFIVASIRQLQIFIP